MTYSISPDSVGGAAAAHSPQPQATKPHMPLVPSTASEKRSDEASECISTLVRGMHRSANAKLGAATCRGMKHQSTAPPFVQTMCSSTSSAHFGFAPESFTPHFAATSLPPSGSNRE